MPDPSETVINLDTGVSGIPDATVLPARSEPSAAPSPVASTTPGEGVSPAPDGSTAPFLGRFRNEQEAIETLTRQEAIINQVMAERQQAARAEQERQARLAQVDENARAEFVHKEKWNLINQRVEQLTKAGEPEAARELVINALRQEATPPIDQIVAMAEERAVQRLQREMYPAMSQRHFEAQPDLSDIREFAPIAVKLEALGVPNQEIVGLLREVKQTGYQRGVEDFRKKYPSLESADPGRSRFTQADLNKETEWNKNKWQSLFGKPRY